MRRVQLVLSVSLLLSACRGTDTGVHWEFERMLVQPRYDAYGASDLFPDGRAMRTPPVGTVPREGITGGALARDGVEAGRYAESIPISMTDELLRTGQERFDIYCAVCHGVVGTGASPVAAKMQLRPPPSLHVPRIRSFPPGQLYQVVKDGYGLMPSYAKLLSVEERWAVVAYVEALQLSQYARIDELPEALRAEVLRELARTSGSPQPMERGAR